MAGVKRSLKQSVPITSIKALQAIFARTEQHRTTTDLCEQT